MTIGQWLLANFKLVTILSNAAVIGFMYYAVFLCEWMGQSESKITIFMNKYIRDSLHLLIPSLILDNKQSDLTRNIRILKIPLLLTL